MNLYPTHWWNSFTGLYEWAPELDGQVRKAYHMKAGTRLRDLRYWVLNRAKERPKWLGKTIYETMKKKSQEPAFLEKSEKAKKNRRGGSLSNPVEPSHFQGSISAAQHAKKMAKSRGGVLPTAPELFLKTHFKTVAGKGEIAANKRAKQISYSEFEQQGFKNDVESGTEGMNLDKFFEDVEKVKEDMKEVEKIYKRLQDQNEESKVVHNAKTMKELRARMDSDVSLVLKKVKIVKAKLEALDKSNVQARNVPGCGPGSSADRTRTSVVSGLGKKLKDMMDNFQALRAKMQSEYKETMERRYFTITGEKADETMIENLIASGESENFLQKAIQDQGRGQILDTISELQERHDAVKEIEKNLIELHQVFLDMAALVEAQGQQLNNIESHVAHASSFVRRGTEELVEARVQQKNSRKWYCYAILAGIVLIFVLVFPLFINIILPHLVR
ncbi:hypothetical protein BVRB_8g200170 [Beta vulgaris subsp. vulgaris]|uniref:t-SNARE coiled-coil homology domain-containing protein n=1 Tax=Beta vulgaris subsp. vulgaris TaxID=3555 RepID=A0A7G2RMH8_BETVV|nr:hypothetical protein BVRB_8g200170 [Beta vulgaris subsp. vulgaris]